MKGHRCLEMQVVRSSIKEEHQYFQRMSFVDHDHPQFFRLLQSKVDSLPLRGYFSKKLFDYSVEALDLEVNEEQKELFAKTLPFILEVVITIQYYHNQILDGKGGIKTKGAIKQHLLKGNLLKDLLYTYIEDRLPQRVQPFVFGCVRKVFKFTDIGQYIEKGFNTYEAYCFEERFDVPFESAINTFVDPTCISFLMTEHAKENKALNPNTRYLEWYFKRIYLVSASLFQLFTTTLFELLGIADDQKTAKNLSLFASYYGVMLQLVNDNCDWVPSVYQHKTVAKNYEDTFSDLKNRNITYPSYLYLSEGNHGGILQYLSSNDRNISDDLQWLMFQEIVDVGVMKRAIQMGKKLGQQALSFLDTQNTHWEIFEDMTKISSFNRYYYHFFKEMKRSQVKYC